MSLFWAFLFISAFGQKYFYVSPGIKLNYIPGKGMAFGIKFSVGRYECDHFYNVTFGALGALSPDTDYSYRFLEVQYGAPSPLQKKASTYAGGGFGIIIHQTKPEKIISPRLTLFTGIGLFGEINFYQNEKRKFSWEAGGEAVLPIPFGDAEIFAFPN